MKKWTLQEILYLKNQYPLIGKMACAKFLNRKEGSIRQKTSSLKLKQNINSPFFNEWQNRAKLSKIGKKRPDQAIIMKNLIKEGKLFNKKWRKEIKKNKKRMKIWWKTHPHPKGMLGKYHSLKEKKKMSERTKKLWLNPNSKFNSKSFRQKQSDRMSKQMHERFKNKGTIYSRTHNGWYRINKKKYYFRSSWEVNYARYLEWLLSKNKIKKWEQEPDTFWFNAIKRGVRSYLPDFKIINLNNSIEYHEVKGWMDSKSKTKLRRMKRYYPNVKLLLIDKIKYKEILKWERMFPEALKNHT